MTDAQKPALVLLHGWGANAGIWQDARAELSGRYEILTPELPGHGDSGLAMKPLAELAIDIADSLPQPAIWLGWSLGGLLALHTALARPDKVRQLLLVSGFLRFIATDDDGPGMPPADFEAFQLGIASHPDKTLLRFFALQAFGDINARQVHSLLKSAYRLPDHETLSWGLAQLRQTDLRGQVGDLPMPVHCLHGEGDAVVSLDSARLLAAQTGADLTQWPATGHAPFLSDPARFYRWLREALT